MTAPVGGDPNLSLWICESDGTDVIRGSLSRRDIGKFSEQLLIIALIRFEGARVRGIGIAGRVNPGGSLQSIDAQSTIIRDGPFPKLSGNPQILKSIKRLEVSLIALLFYL